MWVLLFSDNEAIKLHSQILSIDINKAINFNKAPLYRSNYLVLFTGALFHPNDATFQIIWYRWVMRDVDCPIIFIVLFLSFSSSIRTRCFGVLSKPNNGGAHPFVRQKLSISHSSRCLHRRQVFILNCRRQEVLYYDERERECQPRINIKRCRTFGVSLKKPACSTSDVTSSSCRRMEGFDNRFVLLFFAICFSLSLSLSLSLSFSCSLASFLSTIHLSSFRECTEGN